MIILIQSSAELNNFAYKISDQSNKKISANAFKQYVVKMYDFKHIQALNAALDNSNKADSSSITSISKELASYRDEVEDFVLADSNNKCLDDMCDDDLHNSEDGVTSAATELSSSPELANAVHLLEQNGMSDIAGKIKSIALSSEKFQFVMKTIYS
jgi:hypothetical protein